MRQSEIKAKIRERIRQLEAKRDRAIGAIDELERTGRSSALTIDCIKNTAYTSEERALELRYILADVFDEDAFAWEGGES